MKKAIVFLLLIFSVNISLAQFKGYKVKGGAHYFVISPSGEFVRDLTSLFARGFVAFELGKYVDVEAGGGYLRWVQKDQYNGDGLGKVEATLIPLDIRIRLEPFAPRMKYVNPYVYVGGGLVKHKLNKYPSFPTYVYPYDSVTSETDTWTAFFPLGAGLEIKLSKQFLIDLQAGSAITLTDKINGNVVGDPKDGWFNFGLGLVVTGKSGRDDTDRDGLYDDEEEDIYTTDPENPDTDADGLKDGEEVKTYKTDPKNPDSDGDGLKDGEEVKSYGTNPMNPDTDADGLRDNEEVLTYLTNPNNPDSDNDGLTDGDEVRNTRTDPLKADTDGDTLNDGDETTTYRTDPLKADTDAGSVDDGTEVRRGTNPLVASDDVVKEEEIKIGQVMILEGINFETNSANITPDSETILMKAYNTMVNNPAIEVEISGHTDSRGSNSANQSLSERRANSVKEWLVSKGVNPARITTVGHGEDMPIAPNDSPENMLKNRRIEFKRTK